VSSPEPITAPGIHDMPPASVTSPLTQQQWKSFGDATVKILIAQVLYAISGINVLGVSLLDPFGLLRAWADDLVQQANDAYNGAANAQASANYANMQLLIQLGTDLASDVPGGVALTEQFNGAAASDFGANFVRVSAGAGAGVYGPNGSGHAVWTKSGGQVRDHHDRHVTPLTTRYQLVVALMSAPPQPPFGGGQAYNMLRGRVNAAQDTYVYAAIFDNMVQIGCVVSGTGTLFNQVALTPATGDVWAFYLGTDDDDREFVLKRNDIVIWSGVDSGAVSQVDDTDYLYVGHTAHAHDRGAGIPPFVIPFATQTVPGNLDIWAAADRLPTSL